MGEFSFFHNNNNNEFSFLLKRNAGKKTVQKDNTQEKASSREFKSKQRKLIRLNNLKEIIDLPGKNSIFFIKSRGKFDAITFLDLIIEKKGYVEESYLSSYGLSKKSIDTFRYYLKEKQIGKLSYMGSNSFKARFPNETGILMNIKDNYNFSVNFDDSHQKVYLFKCSDDYYTIEGSGNLTMNSKFEQYTFTNSKEIFDFFKEDF